MGMNFPGYAGSLLIGFAIAAGPGLPFEVRGTAEARRDESPQICLARARKEARSKAIESTGVHVTDLFFDIQAALGSRERQAILRYQQTLSQGLVLPDETRSTQHVTALPDGSLRCEVDLAGVVIDTGRPDPGYRIEELHLSQPSYYEGQEATVSMRVTRDSFVYLLNIDENENVTLIFPNEATPERGHYLRAGKPFRYPGEEAKKKGVRIVAALEKGKPQSVEIVQAIAVREERDLFSMADTTPKILGPYRVYGIGTMSEVIRRLAALERPRWTMGVTAYEIKKPEQGR